MATNYDMSATIEAMEGRRPRTRLVAFADQTGQGRGARPAVSGGGMALPHRAGPAPIPRVSMATINWGIIGAGAIAKAFAKGIKGSKTGKLVAVASRDAAKAEAFAREHADASCRCYGGYDA